MCSHRFVDEMICPFPKANFLFLCSPVCYGIYESVLQRESWKCDRCLESDYEAACCLCPLRGGPLKRTTSYKWAHIVCSLVLPDVQFENYLALKPIDVNEIEDCHVVRFGLLPFAPLRLLSLLSCFSNSCANFATRTQTLAYFQVT